MAKTKKNSISEEQKNQGEIACPAQAGKIKPLTEYRLCNERLSSFDGLFGLVKFIGLVKFEGIFPGFHKPLFPKESDR